MNKSMTAIELRGQIATLKIWLETLENDDKAAISAKQLSKFLTDEEISDMETSENYNSFEVMASGDPKELWKDIKSLISTSNLISGKPHEITTKSRRTIFTKSERIMERFVSLSPSDQSLFIRTDGVEKINPFANIEDYPPPIPIEYSDQYLNKYSDDSNCSGAPQSAKTRRNQAQQNAIEGAIRRLTTPVISNEEKEKIEAKRLDMMRRLSSRSRNRRD